MAKNRKSSSFSGWQGRSGLDPVETSRINANVDGIFLRRLLTLSLRTRNIFSLLAMLVFGISATGLMLVFFYATSTMPLVGEPDFLYYLAITVIYLICGVVFLIGIALLANFAINLAVIFGFVRLTPGLQNGNELDRKERKKKLPKRRKDFK